MVGIWVYNIKYTILIKIVGYRKKVLYEGIY